VIIAVVITLVSALIPCFSSIIVRTFCNSYDERCILCSDDWTASQCEAESLENDKDGCFYYESTVDSICGDLQDTLVASVVLLFVSFACVVATSNDSASFFFFFFFTCTTHKPINNQVVVIILACISASKISTFQEHESFGDVAHLPQHQQLQELPEMTPTSS
jgi:hypothetical protein